MFSQSSELKKIPCPYLSLSQPCELEEFCAYNHNFTIHVSNPQAKDIINSFNVSTETLVSESYKKPVTYILEINKPAAKIAQEFFSKPPNYKNMFPLLKNTHNSPKHILKASKSTISNKVPSVPIELCSESALKSENTPVNPPLKLQNNLSDLSLLPLDCTPNKNKLNQNIKQSTEKSSSNVSSNSSSTIIYPSVKPLPNQKVKWDLRQAVLKKIHTECLRIYSSTLPIDYNIISEKSLQKELEVYAKSTPTTYKNTALSTITSLKKALSSSPVNPINHTSTNLNPDLSSKSPNDSITSTKTLATSHQSKIIDIDDPKIFSILEFFILPSYKLEIMDYPLESVLESSTVNITAEESNTSSKKIISDFMDIVNKSFLKNKASGIFNRQLSNASTDKINLSKIDSFIDIQFVCDRCNQLFINQSLIDFPQLKLCCNYHSGKLRYESLIQKSSMFMVNKSKYPIASSKKRTYTCCGGTQLDHTCDTGPHVFCIKNDSILHLISNFEKPSLDNTEKKYKLLALDCEMCATTMGYELSRLTVVDHFGTTIIDELVKPLGEVVDLNTRYSGVKSLDNAKCTFKEIKSKLLELVSSQTILLGHGLENDLRALRLVHGKVIDTANGLPFRKNLKDLAFSYLGNIIQNSTSGHDSLEDSLTCLYLLDFKIKSIMKIKSS
ncbi:hypothetical protein BB561_002670 [Smittium simulii]|uniref:Exonuclease domain-containing protein n=1 Tax=Smittium simulii TaxID=133385 RepID=A0A2T9YPM8_9FUNG|nr:hypothetical protein BB561_002670 [Smittium simulii]